MKYYILSAIILTIARPLTVLASVLIPGETEVPDQFVPSAGDYESLTSTILPTTAGVMGDSTFPATVGMTVFREPSGTLTFSYNLASPVENPVLTLLSVQMSGFKNVTTDLQYQHDNTPPGVTQLAPISVQRSADGDTVLFNFPAGGLNGPGTSANLSPGQFTVDLLVRTNATGYAVNGLFTSQFSEEDGLFVPSSIRSFSAISPSSTVPEPATLVGLLIGPAILLIRRR